MNIMKRIIPFFLWLSLVACSQGEPQNDLVEGQANSVGQVNTINNTAIMEAYKNKQSDVWVEGSGEVIKLLKDDTYGSQHQRFVLIV